jgi:hypothetical protein
MLIRNVPVSSLNLWKYLSQKTRICIRAFSGTVSKEKKKVRANPQYFVYRFYTIRNKTNLWKKKPKPFAKTKIVY